MKARRMISLSELNPHKYPTSEEQDRNLLELQRRINIIRAAYGKPMTVTSGLRSNLQQELLIASGRSKAKHSRHLTGQAVDISDDGKIKPWLLANVPLLEHAGLWLEDFSATPQWAHFQSVAPGSGKRFFNP